MPESIEHLVDAHSFRVAFLVAAGATVVLAIAGLALRRFLPGRAPLPLAGLAGAAAAAAALHSSNYWSRDLLVGLGALAGGGLVITVLGRFLEAPLLLGFAAAVPGALLIGSAADVTPYDWVQPFVVIAIVVAASLVAEFDDFQARAGYGPVFLAVTALGLYWTVPDTEEAVALVGASLPLILLGFPKPLASLGGAGSFAMVGVAVWLAAVDGRGRESSIVGATACFGVMLLDPLLDRILPTRAERVVGPWSWPPLLVAAIHLGLVFVAARVAGTRESLLDGTAIALAAFGVGGLVLALIPQYVVEDRSAAT